MTDEKLLRAIGDQIKTKRKQLNLRQNEIESIATDHYEHFKISQPRISEIEHGQMHMENTSFLTSKELTVLGTVLHINWQKLLFNQKQIQILIVKHIRKEYDINRYPLLPDYMLKQLALNEEFDAKEIRMLIMQPEKLFDMPKFKKLVRQSIKELTISN